MTLFMRLFYATLIGVLLAASTPLHAQQLQAKNRPKVGLALSGGGAKGLSHIGALMVLEKAGICVDYIVGTSMGAVIGALYSMGYSADTIAQIARTEDWDYMLAGKPGLRQISIEEKADFGRYLLEIPIVEKRLKFPRGLIDGQELSVELSRLTFPVYGIKNFTRLPIPFKCIATDITNGEIVVLDSGNLAEAVRASMAIPSIFTPVKYQNRLLVDGGIVRNFPVEHVKEMGADVVIGINLSKGFLPENELESLVDIINQSMFLSDGDDTRKQREWCDYLIEPDLSGYGAGSFNQTDSLIKRGYDAAMMQFDALQALAEKLNRVYEPAKPVNTAVIDSVKITGFEVEGVGKQNHELIIDRLGLTKNRWYNASDFVQAVKKVYGIRYFRKVGFELYNQNEQVHMRVKGIENPSKHLNVSLNYNSFSKASLILNFTARNVFLKNSRFSSSLNFADVFRFKTEYFMYLGKAKTHGLGLSAQFDNFNFPVYEQFNRVAIYDQRYTAIDVKYQIASLTVNTLSFGIKREYTNYTPNVFGGTTIYNGNVSHNKAYTAFHLNTLNRHYYATSGSKVSIELGYIFYTSPNVSWMKRDSSSGEFSTQKFTQTQLDTLLTYRYVQVKLSAERHDQLAKKCVLTSGIQAGFTVNPYSVKNDANTIYNNFMLGGLLPNFRNQFSVVGLNDFQLNTNNFMAASFALQYEWVKNTFITPKSSLLYHYQNLFQTITGAALADSKNYILGYGISLGYLSIIGPVDVTIMRSSAANNFVFYINLGHNF